MKNVAFLGLMALVAASSCFASPANTLLKVKTAISNSGSYRVDQLRADYVVAAVAGDRDLLWDQLKREFGACVKTRAAAVCLSSGCQVRKPSYTGEGEYTFLPAVTIDNMVEHIDLLCE
jgi:hypothetical protein